MQKMTIFLIEKSQSEKCQKSKKWGEWAIRIFVILTQKVNFKDPSVQIKFIQISYVQVFFWQKCVHAKMTKSKKVKK